MKPLIRANLSLCLGFALVYRLLYKHDPSSFNEEIDLVDAVYFSVVTQTTVGYGQIKIRSQIGRAVASLHIVLSMYLNVLTPLLKLEER